MRTAAAVALALAASGQSCGSVIAAVAGVVCVLKAHPRLTLVWIALASKHHTHKFKRSCTCGHTVCTLQYPMMHEVPVLLRMCIYLQQSAQQAEQACKVCCKDTTCTAGAMTWQNDAAPAEQPVD